MLENCTGQTKPKNNDCGLCLIKGFIVQKKGKAIGRRLHMKAGC